MVGHTRCTYVRHRPFCSTFIFFFNDPPTTEIYTLSLHDALPISRSRPAAASASGSTPSRMVRAARCDRRARRCLRRSEEHTSELQSRGHLVCRLLLEKKKNNTTYKQRATNTSIARPLT